MTPDYPHSTLLFGGPAAAEGAARVFDLAGLLTEYNRSPTVAAADRLALASDWRAVAADLRRVFPGRPAGAKATGAREARPQS